MMLKNPVIDKRILITPNSSISNALKKIKNSGSNCLLVATRLKLLGTLTDGDIRKAILDGKKISHTVKNIYNRNPFCIRKKEYREDIVSKAFLEKKYTLIPILDDNNKIISTLSWDQFFGKKLHKKPISNPLVVMAGGYGTRMMPFTNVLPKPLIPLGDQTVIEVIINRFHRYGIKDVFVSINYKSLIMKAFFQELKPTYKVNFLQESKPLGTIGVLSKLTKQSKPIFVSNCDILVDTDYRDIIEYHKESKSDLTIVASSKETIIPYGVCNISKEGYLASIDEKPKINHLINCGLYLINPDLLRLIPKNKRFDITDLFNLMIKKNLRIGVFPVSDDAWVDVGQWDVYRKAIKELS
jgi:dTDP-glucose pyrophosphorylase